MTSLDPRLIQYTIDEWQELGFYYDFDSTNNQWLFYGSKQGLLNLCDLLNTFTTNSKNESISEHFHCLPYWYLKFMTWHVATITEKYFAGSLDDLKLLSAILGKKISETDIGQDFSLDKEYGVNNTATTKFFIMDNDFLPYTFDKLIPSN